MNEIIFRPRSGDDESGEFILSIQPCINQLKNHIERHGITRDSMLLQWITTVDSTESQRVPDEHDERIRFVVAELLDTHGDCIVRCTQCNHQVSISELKREEWDDSTNVEGIRVGSFGYNLVCNHGHVLLIVSTGIY